MGAFKNVNGTWTPVKHIWKNINGTWTKVRKRSSNVANTWKSSVVDNDFEVFSLGLGQTVVAATQRGLWMNGNVAVGAVRSYNLVTFDKVGNIVLIGQYDVFGDASATPPVTTNIDRMTADLNSLASGTPFVVFTYDEPLDGHTNTNLLNAMLRVGATQAVYGTGNAGFAYRSAYLLLGIVGQAAVVEKQRGVDTSSTGNGGDPNACLDYTFNIVNGAFTNVVEKIGN